MARDPALHTVTSIASAGPQSVAIALPYDGLSAPENDDLITAGLSLWPQGPAWGSPDGQAIDLSSNLARFTRVLLSPFEWLYSRAYRLALESSVKGVSELLPEWEADYGLPDNCVTDATTVAERIRALEAKVNSQAVIHPSDFIRVAAAYGFTIEIEEGAIFECGFSEIGGEHETGAASEETYWAVRVDDLSIDYFRAGLGECGFDELFNFGEAERLLCILRRLAPAWTLPVLWPPRPQIFITTEDGDFLGDQDLTPLTVY
ncbi:putative phage tail protein [Pararhizobium sp. O133]|uniref:putative phage tail protein n=1 Tax=Pararhizobium sp. O133 TaxID=3449278 RepID=UPI003F685ED9